MMVKWLSIPTISCLYLEEKLPMIPVFERRQRNIKSDRILVLQQSGDLHPGASDKDLIQYHKI